MYTQCSHCKAIFRVTMKELTAAQGLLRCGECDAIFDAMRSLSTTLPEERRFAQSTPSSPVVEPPEYHTIKKSTASKLGFFGRVKQTVTAFFQRFTARKITNPDTLHNYTRHQSTNRAGFETQQPAGSKVFLFLGIGALALLLLLQLLYSKRNWLALQPLTASLTQRTCLLLGCEIAIPRDVRQIKLLSRNVYSHPNTPNVLTISVSIQNDASFIQPYPLIEISFLNKKNAVVALRRFTPEEYLKEVKQELMPIGTPIELILNISDPGTEAVRFQFRFI